MIALLIIYCVIGCFVGLLMFGIGIAGGRTPWWQKVIGFPIFLVVGQLWGPYILWVTIG